MEIVTLTTNDGKDFQMERTLAEQFVTVKNLIEDAGTENPIPLPSVSGPFFQKAVEYVNHHSQNPTDETWDTTFTTEMDQSTLFEVILAANYLDQSNLLDLCCKAVANMIKGKTPDEIRKTFNIKDDFTEEEKEQVAKENEWLEEK